MSADIQAATAPQSSANAAPSPTDPQIGLAPPDATGAVLDTGNAPAADSPLPYAHHDTPRSQGRPLSPPSQPQPPAPPATTGGGVGGSGYLDYPRSALQVLGRAVRRQSFPLADLDRTDIPGVLANIVRHGEHERSRVAAARVLVDMERCNLEAERLDLEVSGDLAGRGTSVQVNVGIGISGPTAEAREALARLRAAGEADPPEPQTPTALTPAPPVP